MLHRWIPVGISKKVPFVRNFSDNLNKGFLSNLMSVFGFRGRTTLGSARTLLFACKDHAEKQVWYTNGKVGNEFRSKHTLLLMHIWLVHRRLLNEGKEGKLLQECLFDELWDDTCSRIRALGVGELSVNKHLRDVQGYSFRFCVELDHALSLPVAPVDLSALANSEELPEGVSLDDEEPEVDTVTDSIGGTLWRMLYLRRKEVKQDDVLHVVKYLQSELDSVLTLPKDELLKGDIHWQEPVFLATDKSTDRASSSSSSTSDSSTGDSSGGSRSKYAGSVVVDAEEEWRQAIASDGRTYYWNTRTRQSRWDRPEGGKK